MSQSKRTDDPHPISPLPKASPGIPALSPKEARLQTPVKRPHFRFVYTSAASPVEVHSSQHTGDTARVALTLFSLRVPGVKTSSCPTFPAKHAGKGWVEKGLLANPLHLHNLETQQRAGNIPALPPQLSAS